MQGKETASELKYVCLTLAALTGAVYVAGERTQVTKTEVSTTPIDPEKGGDA
jgi:hypothetical protein